MSTIRITTCILISYSCYSYFMRREDCNNSLFVMIFNNLNTQWLVGFAKKQRYAAPIDNHPTRLSRETS